MKFKGLIFIFISLFISFPSLASVDISDSELKVLAIEDMRNVLGKKYSWIEDLKVNRVTSQDGVEHAVGILNIWTSKKGCWSFLVITDSLKCNKRSQCRLKHMTVDCSGY